MLVYNIIRVFRVVAMRIYVSIQLYSQELKNLRGNKILSYGYFFAVNVRMKHYAKNKLDILKSSKFLRF